MNQIGSVTESIEAVRMSKRAGWGVMASHRRCDMFLYNKFILSAANFFLFFFLKCGSLVQYSGETEDTFIADLSVGLATVSVFSSVCLIWKVQFKVLFDSLWRWTYASLYDIIFMLVNTIMFLLE